MPVGRFNGRINRLVGFVVRTSIVVFLYEVKNALCGDYIGLFVT